MIAVMDCSSDSSKNDGSSCSNLAANDETGPKVKFLCSFGGSILPRPQDGKLRYVGGETRIVSVPRDVGIDELMARMRELYEGVAILKYQQPDEDLDALVSVVNDDDVTNMMEEYDKLGSADGFTRLRIFLFSHPEQDVSPHFMEGDERDSERRYVDALNSLSDGMSPDYRRQQMGDSPVLGPVDEVQLADQLFKSMNLEGSVHNLRNYEMGLPGYNLRQLAVPTLGSGYVAPQRYNEEGSWSPAYYSPRFAENPSSPSSARFLGALHQDGPEEPSHLHMNSQIPFEQQHQYSENLVWLPTGGVPVERGGFPGNIINGPNVADGSNVCGHCKVNYQRNPSSSDFHRKPDEQPAVGNGFPQVSNPCVECHPRREAAMLNADPNLFHGVYNREQSDPYQHYNEAQYPDRGWLLQNQMRMDEQRAQISGVGRIGEHYTNGTGQNAPVGQTNLSDGNLMPSNYTRHEDPRYARPGVDPRSEIYQNQAVGAGPHLHAPFEERSMRASNLPSSYGPDMSQQVLHTSHSAQSLWRNPPSPMYVTPAYDSYNIQPRTGMPNTGAPRNNMDDRPSLIVGGEQNLWAESSHRMLGVNEPSMQEFAYGNAHNLTPGAPFKENQQTFTHDHLRNPPSMLNVSSVLQSQRSSELPANLLIDSLLPSGAPFNESQQSFTHGQLRHPASMLNVPSALESQRSSEIPANVLIDSVLPVERENTGNVEASFDEKNVLFEARETTHLRDVVRSDLSVVHPTEVKKIAEKNPAEAAFGSNSVHPGDQAINSIQPGVANTNPVTENEDLSFLPELIASAKRAKMESVEIVKAKAQEDINCAILPDEPTKLANVDEIEPQGVDEHSEGGSDDESVDVSKIEPTKAEEEAIAKGLQTIQSADLEEIRELGTGTYGAVYYGKWKGSDVAIKRIKASCFTGRPSERERLIADFWKEALIMSSLHHPNVVSFYGIVRDGPDGSLATVSEFMVNGSLKQYLQKKDRTIDRRKRLIIAMDAAFGMEYLHGKNIVHFDLKCENLLVNMRDPHRPVCKIGDLGLSKVKQHTLVSGGVRGTLPWMAPELLSGKSNMVTEKIDVYSFGVVMWEVLTGEEPYKDLHCASIIGGIVNNSLRPQIPAWCDPEWKCLMESCWAPDPAERPSFPEISQKLRAHFSWHSERSKTWKRYHTHNNGMSAGMVVARLSGYIWFLSRSLLRFVHKSKMMMKYFSSIWLGSFSAKPFRIHPIHWK